MMFPRPSPKQATSLLPVLQICSRAFEPAVLCFKGTMVPWVTLSQPSYIGAKMKTQIPSLGQVLWVSALRAPHTPLQHV